MNTNKLAYMHVYVYVYNIHILIILFNYDLFYQLCNSFYYGVFTTRLDQLLPTHAAENYYYVSSSTQTLCYFYSIHNTANIYIIICTEDAVEHRSLSILVIFSSHF